MKVKCSACGWESENIYYSEAMTLCTNPCPKCRCKGTVARPEELARDRAKLRAWREAAK